MYVDKHVTFNTFTLWNSKYRRLLHTKCPTKYNFTFKATLFKYVYVNFNTQVSQTKANSNDKAELS